MIKKEIRIIALDDGYFEKFKQKHCLVIGVIYRGAEFIDGLISFRVKVDGWDATQKLINAVNKSKHKNQLSLIMINGIALGGLNLIDVEKINKKTKLPVLIVSRKKPRPNLIKKILQQIGQEKKARLIDKAGKIREFKINGKKIYFQIKGLDEAKVRAILKMTIKRSLIPEPLRVAHLIASGITLGENRGRV